MQLRRYKNLVPDSPLHRGLESLLLENKGCVPLQTVCEEVLSLPTADPITAEQLVAALIEDDSRMRFNGNATLEWVEPTAEEIWNSTRRFLVVDLETTNHRRQQRIIEMGVCRVENGKIVDEWSALVNPGRPISRWVQQMTGITERIARRAPRLEKILPRLLNDLEDSILVAHHARFDFSCLDAEINRILGQRITNRYLCTVELSRCFLPGSENYRLETLSQWLGLRHDNPHRAGSDARATAELFCHLLRRGEVPWPEYLRPKPGLANEGKKKKGAKRKNTQQDSPT